MTRLLLVALLTAAWIAGEFVIDRRYRSAGGGESRDAGSLTLLHRVIGTCIALAIGLGIAGVGRWPTGLQLPLYATGIWLMVAGLGLRWWSVHTLDRWFTVDVAIRAGHQLVRHGPYRLLRHPSYTGMLMVIHGLGLALGSWPALLVLSLPSTWALLRRIRLEERVLAQAFPQEWPGYAARTHRLVPGLW